MLRHRACREKAGSIGDKQLCSENYFCPKTSTTTKGNPAIADIQCGGECKCGDGFLCPQSSTTKQGQPAAGTSECATDNLCSCHKGYFCENGVKVKCDGGYYCDETGTTKKRAKDKPCAAKHWCPEGSTDSTGKPVEKVGDCAKNAVCNCFQGFWCPPGSTTEKGKPTADRVEDTVRCDKSSECKCEAGYFCSTGSDKPKQKTCNLTGNRDLKQYFCP